MANEPIDKGKKRLNSGSPNSESTFLQYKKLREYFSSTSSSESCEESMNSDGAMSDIENIIKKRMENYQEEMISTMDKNKKELLDSLMTAFGKRVDTLEARVTQLEEENGELKKRLENTDPNVKSVIGIQEARIVELEQYSRRTKIKIFGVPETANNGGKENTVDIVKNIFENRLQQTITSADILAAH